MLCKTPPECPRNLLEKASALPAVDTVIVNAGSLPAMESARQSVEAGLIRPILVGNPDEINAIALDIDWSLKGVRIIPAFEEQQAAEVSIALARSGEAQMIMKGHLHSDTLIRAVLNREQGLRTGNRLSHVFYMTVPGSEKSLCITDAVVNVQPNIDTKMAIARNAVELLHALGNALPKMAVLSGTEVVSEAMPSSVEAAEVTRRAAAGEISGAIVDGPMALDNAISIDAANMKGINSPVAGNADILLVPNLESGNMLFKKMVYFMSATAAGLLMGARVPIVLTSRADPPEARLASAALAVIYNAYQAGHNESSQRRIS
ncbi:MAG: bifunctional enoyl-CoA hydratase/phosphate acetyltransferase [Halopseudomonas sp.]